MGGAERRGQESVAWRPKAPTRAVGVAPPDQVPFMPDESEMAEGIRAAERVDAATTEVNDRSE